MKKIISILVIAMLLLTSALAALPASAATSKTLDLDWTKFAYEAYNEHGDIVSENSFLNNFTITKNSTTFGVSRNTTSGNSVSYISTSKFAITKDTDYTYEVMGKNNQSRKYSGIPFAIGPDGVVYFIYGSFDNDNDSTNDSGNIVFPGKSYVIGAKGDFNNKYPNTNKNELDAMYFAKLQQTDGFASFKFEYNGLTVTVYAKDQSGNYIKMGEDIPLPEGSSVAFGLFSRDASNGGNRTTTLKNGKITANNQEAVDNLIISANNGATELRAEILLIEQEHPEANYTESSYAALKSALINAKSIADDLASTSQDVENALTALQYAVECLELKKADTTKLEAAIKRANKLNEVEWTEITYAMVMGAVEAGEELLDRGDATQVEIDEATAAINGRIDSLQPSGMTAPEEEEEEEKEDDGNAEKNTDDVVATDAPSSKVPAIKKSCKSAVGSTALVVALVSTLGTALVIKKKD